MGILDSLKHKKSIEEVEQETEELEANNRNAEVELSYVQKKAAIARLKESGLTPKHFDFSWPRILAWIKSH
jgi:hypothetical protein